MKTFVNNPVMSIVHNKYSILAVCVIFIATGSAQAVVQAVVMEGQTVRYRYYFPNLSTTYWVPSDAVVGTGVEYPSLNGPTSDYATIDISNTNILVDFYSSATWVGASFNGFVIQDVNGTIPSFTGVTIAAGTNMIGFDASRIGFDANNIYVNWQGLTFNSNTIVSLNVATASVPEPASVLLGVLKQGCC